MAGDWIKMRWNLAGDPDVIKIAAATKLDEFGVVGRLHAVWSWLDQHSADGTNVRIVSAFLDRLTACPGFAEAMRAVGWLTGRDGSLTFPGYEVHNGESAKRRASETRRKQGQRNSQHGEVKTRDKCPIDDGTNVPDNPGPEKRREDTSIIHSPRRGWSLEEVTAAGNLASISPEVCKLYHDSRMAVEWVDRNGNPIKSMPHDLAKFAAHYKSNDAEKSQNGRKPRFDAAPRPEGVWQLKERKEAIQAEMRRIQADEANHERNPDTPWEKSLKPEAAEKIRKLKETMSQINAQIRAA
jgi:hypothetical protein